MLTGWKTYIGMALVLIAVLGRAIKPDLEEVWIVLETAGIGLGGVGLVHKGVRTIRSGD